MKLNVSPKNFILSFGLATFFFASLFTGPVFSGYDAHTKLREMRQTDTELGLFKILEGFVFILPLSQLVTYSQQTISQYNQDSSLFIVDIAIRGGITPLLTFLFVFTTFFGYSKVAEGVAHLLGFNVPRNFNQPYKSTSFSDFWQRWHRLMADFVMKYLYLPISIHLKNPKLGLMSGFVFMGLWHNLSLGYLVWGIAHGGALIWIQPKLHPDKIPVFAARIITLTYVVYISYLANYWLK